MKKEFMRVAIKEAYSGMKKNHGGPFGAVVIRRNKIVAKGHNEVIISKDPTSHAEIVAIRKASKKLRRFNLSDCELYASCEPCPMCLGAIQWARINTVYYGCRKEDTVKIGFDDKAFYDSLKRKELGRLPITIETSRKECLALFKAWKEKENKILY